MLDLSFLFTAAGAQPRLPLLQLNNIRFHSLGPPPYEYRKYPFNCRCAVLSFNPSKRIRHARRPRRRLLPREQSAKPPPCPSTTANSPSTAKLASQEYLPRLIGDSAPTSQAPMVRSGCYDLVYAISCPSFAHCSNFTPWPLRATAPGPQDVH